MKILKDDVIKGRNGVTIPFKESNDSEAVDSRFFQMIHKIAGQYMPTQSLTLKISDIRKLNKAIDVIETIKDGESATFDDEVFEVLKKVTLELIVHTNLAIYAPVFEDFFNGAKDK